MKRRTVVATMVMAAALAWPGAASAQGRELSGAEVEAWISGNTVIGTWAGDAYRQYFSPEGWTDYDQAGVPVDRGRWWVTNDRYCSNWDSSGDACYRVLRDGDTLIWETRGVFGRRFTAEVVPGNQLAP